ncbi:MAG: ABC transporter ATP-binding protein [Pseudomonadota bacterium]
MHRTHGWRPSGSLYSLILAQTFRLQILIIVLGLALPPLVVLPLHLQERIIDEAIPAGDIDQLFWYATLFAAAVGLTSAIKFVITFCRGWIAEIVARVLRATLIDAQRSRRPDHAQSALGDVTSVLTAEVDPLGGFAAEALNTPLIQGGTLLGVFGFMLYVEPVLAVIGIVALLAEATITPILQHYINRLTHERITTLRRAGRDMIEAADPEQHEKAVEGLREVRHTYRVRLTMNLLKAALKIARNLIDHAADIAVIVLGALMVIRGETEIGVVVAFLSGLREVRDPWGELVNFYRRLADARVKYRLVARAISGEGMALPPVPDKPERDGPVPGEPLPGEPLPDDGKSIERVR